MPELTEQRLEEIITKAVRNAIPAPCRYNQYMSDSELTPAKHMEDHQKFHMLDGLIGKTGGKFFLTIVGSLAVFLVVAFGWGIIEILSKKING